LGSFLGALIAVTLYEVRSTNSYVAALDTQLVRILLGIAIVTLWSMLFSVPAALLIGCPIAIYLRDRAITRPFNTAVFAAVAGAAIALLLLSLFMLTTTSSRGAFFSGPIALSWSMFFGGIVAAIYSLLVSGFGGRRP
jgi:RsiW-degrading membrane proteinase PrsW (M82 family)